MKFTQNDFLKRAKEKFGNRYDYTDTIYISSRSIIKYKCNTCKNVIIQYASDHLKGKNGSCSCTKFIISFDSLKEKIKQLNGEYEILYNTREPAKIKLRCKKHNFEFWYYFSKNNSCSFCKKQKLEIKNIEEKYNFGYNYEKADFSDTTKKTIVTCLKHGDFKISEEYLMKGGKCPECLKEQNIKRNKDNFYLKFEKKYGDKFCIISDYKGSEKNIILKCKRCGNIEEIKASNLFNKSKEEKRCGKCEFTKKITKELFLQRAEEIHSNKYNYCLDNLKNSHSYITIYCKKHKKWFRQRAYSHLAGHGCPNCCESNGERIIRVFLEKQKIDFEAYYRFYNLVDKSYLSYDFYIPNKSLLIEYNGLQHYKFCNDFHKTLHDFHRQKHHDWLKRKYARDNNINLLTISYKDDIVKILEEKLK